MNSISVKTDFGELVAVPEEDNFPGIRIVLRQPDRGDMILCSVTDLTKDGTNALRVGFYSNPFVDEMDRKTLLTHEELESPHAQFWKGGRLNGTE